MFPSQTSIRPPHCEGIRKRAHGATGVGVAVAAEDGAGAAKMSVMGAGAEVAGAAVQRAQGAWGGQRGGGAIDKPPRRSSMGVAAGAAGTAGAAA